MLRCEWGAIYLRRAESLACVGVDIIPKDMSRNERWRHTAWASSTSQMSLLTSGMEMLSLTFLPPLGVTSMKDSWQLLSKSKTHALFDPAVPLLETYPLDVFTHVHICRIFRR